MVEWTLMFSEYSESEWILHPLIVLHVKYNNGHTNQFEILSGGILDSSGENNYTHWSLEPF